MSKIESTSERDTDESEARSPTPESSANETTEDDETGYATDESDIGWASGTESYKSEDALPYDEVAETEEDVNEDSSVCETARNVLHCLDHIQHFGSFATQISKKAFVQPLMSVGGSDMVRLPLDEQDISSLTEHMEEVQSKDFSDGSSVGRTWKITSDEISFGEDWKGQVQSIADEVARELGIPASSTNVRPMLRHLQIHGPGTVLESHADTRKHPGSFGTLLISLPVRDQDAEFDFNYEGREHHFNIAEPAVLSLTSLAWYSDVSCQIKGRLCFLQYDLRCNEIEPPASASKLAEELAEVSRVLEAWNQSHWQRYDASKYLCYPLDYHYSNESLTLDKLKDNDYARVRCLAEAGRRFECYVLLGQLQKRVSFANQEEGYEKRRVKFSLCVRDTNGFVFQHEVQCKRNAVDHDKSYGDRTYDDQEGGEYLGNGAYADMCRIYNNTVVIVVNGWSWDTLLLGPHYSASDLRDLFERLCLPRHDANKSYDEILFRIAEGQLHKDCNLREDCSTIKDFRAFHGVIAEIAVYIANSYLLQYLLESTRYGFLLATYRFFGVSFTTYFPEHEISRLEYLFCSKNLYRTWNRMTAFLGGYKRRPRKGNTELEEKKCQQEIKQWICQALTSIKTAKSQDGKALVHICQYFGFSELEKEVKGFVLKAKDNEAFINNFLLEVLRGKNILPTSEGADDLIQFALDVSIPTLTLSYFLCLEEDANQLSMEKAEEAAMILSMLREAFQRSEKAVRDMLSDRFYSQATTVNQDYMKLVMQCLMETEWEDVDQRRRPTRTRGRWYNSRKPAHKRRHMQVRGRSKRL